MTLKLTNNLDKKEYEITGITDTSSSTLNYTFDISLPEGISEGEYTYELIDDEDILATGIAQVGDYTPTKTTYTGQSKNNYIQYNS